MKFLINTDHKNNHNILKELKTQPLFVGEGGGNQNKMIKHVTGVE
jgi:hypothetical protein